MSDPKVTIMVIKVDLQCEKCYKKIKKVLCKFPQIRDQVYDEKNNTVTIKVVCCSPEKIKQKICCKGGDSVKGIEIKQPEKPKEPEKPKPPPPEKPKEPEKLAEKPKEPEPEKPKEPEKLAEKPKEPEKPNEPEKPPKQPDIIIVPKQPPPPTKLPDPIPVFNPVPSFPPPSAGYHPIGVCCSSCYEGRPGGPCYNGYGGPPMLPCYDGGYGRPVYDSWGGGGGGYRSYYGSRCDYFSEENQYGCSVM